MLYHASFILVPYFAMLALPNPHAVPLSGLHEFAYWQCPYWQ